LSGQKGKDAMTRSDCKIGGDAAAIYHRHPLVAKLTNVLRTLLEVPDPSFRRVRWTPLAAGMAAVLMGLDARYGLVTRFDGALGCLRLVCKGRRRVGKTYNGLIKALLRQSSTAMPALKQDLRRQALQVMPRAKGWVVLGVDGTKEDLPRTTSHERHFGIADNGMFPQAFVTPIIEVQTGVVWDWRIGKARASEKAHLLEMIPDLPDRTLLMADGNFVGYAIWSALLKRGADFLIRVGGNVDLIADLFTDHETDVDHQRGVVFVWPKNRRQADPPLRLRLIRVATRDGWMHLLTSVQDQRRLSDKRAACLYRERWGIEVFHRTLKRTLGYAKLRSASGSRAEVELNWALVTMAAIALLAIPAIRRYRVEARRLSAAGALRILRDALHGRCAGDPKRAAAAIMQRLGHAVN
jgi:Transposase DDE domain